MSYTIQYKSIKEAQEKLDIFTSTKTQTGRKTGASNAENWGASEASVDKNGHWKVNSRNGAYANNVLPWECLRVLAGSSKEQGRYYLSRDLLQPPDSLTKLVFPHLERSVEQVKISLGQSQVTSEATGKHFLDVVEYMRIIILQNAYLV